MTGPKGYEELDPDSDRSREIVAAYPLAIAGWTCSSSGLRYVCTRDSGHTGPHVAHLDGYSVAAWWPDGSLEEAPLGWDVGQPVFVLTASRSATGEDGTSVVGVFKSFAAAEEARHAAAEDWADDDEMPSWDIHQSVIS